jgi:A/G-specific adenine glycosylase
VIEKQQKAFFSVELMSWNVISNNRVMPWKGIKDPYKIWLSEIILQQTRVEQGMAYYERFISKFPSVDLLANASDEQIFKLWEGLGYYSRCRNLIHTARYINNSLGGVFPSTMAGLLSLKGVGDYTAAAIASFAFGLPQAVVDGNVLRVLARYFGICNPIDETAGKILFGKLAQELIDLSEPAMYNQAIMDFGATVCKPMQPRCFECPFNATCVANKEKNQTAYPVKSPKKQPRSRWFYYLVLEHQNNLLVIQRKGKGIWKDLHEFFLKEEFNATDESLIFDAGYWGIPDLSIDAGNAILSKEFIHILTHQRIFGRFLHVRIDQKVEIDGYTWLSRNEIDKIAFPRLITKYLEMKEA